MSISINSSPPVSIMPVYNPQYFVVSSNNTAQPNFKYYFQVFSGASATGVPIDTVQLLPRPGLANCIFNPARIIESNVTYDKGIQNITAVTPTTNSVLQYTIDFGESYGLLSTGTTVYSGLQDTTQYTWISTLQYEQIPNWGTIWNNSFSITGGTMFLTNQPRQPGNLVRLSTDHGSLSLLEQFIHPYNKMDLVVYHQSGGTTTTTFTGLTTGTLVHIPSGPWNLNNAGKGTLVDVNNDLKYTIQLYLNNVLTGFTTEVMTYQIDQSCNKYIPVRVQFMNRWGGWDYFNFTLVSRKTLNIINRGTYKQTLAYNYAVGDRQTTIIDIDGMYNYELISDWIDDNTSIWLEEIATSPEVYIINTDGTALPVQPVENSYYRQKMINDRIFNVTYNFTSSWNLNNQRG